MSQQIFKMSQDNYFISMKGEITPHFHLTHAWSTSEYVLRVLVRMKTTPQYSHSHEERAEHF